MPRGEALIKKTTLRSSLNRKKMEKNCECHKEVKKFISNLIDQTREETIRECESVLPEENYKEQNAGTDWSNSGDVHRLGFEIGYNEAVKEIKQSLINLRKKK